MEQVHVYLYDAFSERLFGGNVAGVVLDTGLAEATMQGLAAELAAPTTGFVAPLDDGTWRIRFFTPTQEIDMCGHVTIGVFSALSDLGQLPAPLCTTVARTRAGEIGVEVARPDEGRPTVEMRQRRPSFRSVNVDPRAIAEMLGVQPDDLDTGLPIEIASTALSHLVVPLRNVGILRRLKANNEALTDLSRLLSVDTIPVFASVGLTPGVAVRSRDLCPGIGNAEEAASGTTNGALGCYLVRHNVVPSSASGVVEILAEQGVEMGRPSVIESRIEVDATGGITGVAVRGRAIRVLAGQAYLT